MLELTNRTEEALQMMTGVTSNLAKLEEYMKQKHNWIEKHFNYMDLSDNALELFDLLLTMMLEYRLKAAVYIQDVVGRCYAFQQGVQALLQGKLTINLVPPMMIKAAVAEVTDYFK